ncbi:MAG: hydratase [Treponema sp.]|jgi:aconitate hydratase|nr:hydratase [Treponema sp.]
MRYKRHYMTITGRPLPFLTLGDFFLSLCYYTKAEERMLELYDSGAWLVRGAEIIKDNAEAAAKLRRLGVDVSKEEARRGIITHGILAAHNQSGDDRSLRLRFDSLASHDITYVGIIQTARASGMEKFPMPYVLTNCHNSLCAVGGTINQDDHVFALSAAKKYGGIYVPPHLAVIHTYNREMMAGCGKMILGSDSHTRYGALGTLAVGEGGGELAKQLLGRTYDIACPEVVAVYLAGEPARGVGPHDVALAIIAAVFKNGYVKNKVMEFVGDGIEKLPLDFRNGIDVMTTETTCWSSIWKTDGAVKDYLEARGRGGGYRELAPAEAAYYDGLIYVDLSTIEPCIALPFHPSNVYTIKELQQNARDILAETEAEGLRSLGNPGLGLNLGAKYHDGGVWADQAVIVGCSGGIFDNMMAAADILKGASIGSGNFTMSVYPESQPTYLELVRNGAAETLLSAGVLLREAFCGPCFGAGDTPANGELSIRHATRNFPNREGSKPGEGQIASVALMDARSIAATAINGGRITAATDIDASPGRRQFFFDRGVYDKRVYNGSGKPLRETELILGPNIKDWPKMPALPDNLLIKIVSFITDPVTTTDELIPSGETSSYRSNPLRLAEFTLSRKDSAYVGRAKEVLGFEEDRLAGTAAAEIAGVIKKINAIGEFAALGLSDLGIGSAIYARKIGDGSAREQAASCQRVLGAAANFALEYATKRYRSNLINWGVLPFIVSDEKAFGSGDYVFFPGIKRALIEQVKTIQGYVLGDQAVRISFALGELTGDERQILIDGCLINYYANGS